MEENTSRSSKVFLSSWNIGILKRWNSGSYSKGYDSF
jgi:hypothetical protein